MQAFLNDSKVKEIYLNRVKEHQKLDQIIKGKYWENGKGCAVGCTIHSNQHKSYETELGIPEWLAYVEDSLFEGMSIERSKTWPYEFLNAIKVGVDLDKIKAPFQIIVLRNVLKTLDSIKIKNLPKNIIDCINKSRLCTEDVLKIWESYPNIDQDAARAARAAARAARAAARAARAAARAARAAARAARAAARAAGAAAWAAGDAAWAAGDAARAAGDAAWAAGDAGAAKEKTFEYFADELLRLIKDCK